MRASALHKFDGASQSRGKTLGTSLPPKNPACKTTISSRNHAEFVSLDKLRLHTITRN